MLLDIVLLPKNAFDDYYEFEVGVLSASQPLESAVEEFCIRRPREEGATLSAEGGFDQFEDIRGESGTCVKIRLNEDAVAAGLLDEEKLKPIFLKIVETTQYTVAFSSDGEAQKIIDASELERKAAAEIAAGDHEDDPLDAVADMKIEGEKEKEGAGSHNTVLERAKYIPLRLSLGERKMLRLVEASMTCCDYTTEVDRPFKSSARRTHEQLKGVTAVLRGLVTACDYSAGQKLLGDDDYAEYETFFRQMFEIAVRLERQCADCESFLHHPHPPRQPAPTQNYESGKDANGIRQTHLPATGCRVPVCQASSGLLCQRPDRNCLQIFGRARRLGSVERQAHRKSHEGNSSGEQDESRD